MRIWHWVIAAFLLLTLSANAQQSASPSSSPATGQAPVSAALPIPGSSHGQPEPQARNAARETVAASAPASVPSATMDQVVDRAIEREHALMEMLKTRTPLVETYLQNLKFDRQLGPAPAQDHYFLGRMDFGESLDRRDYLSKDSSFESRLLGGFTRLFKFQYKPMGFSWVIYADRDFNRRIYDFKDVHRVIL